MSRVADRASGTITIGAEPAAVLAVIADFPAYPQWVDMITAAEVLRPGPDGRPAAVRFVLDAGIVKDTYVLGYDWRGEQGVSWHLLSSDGLFRAQDGDYSLVPAGDRSTSVTYTLSVSVQLRVPVLGAFKRKAEQLIVSTALSGLKQRLECRG